MAMEPLIRAVNLHHRYGEGREPVVVALAGLELEVRRGEMVAVIGPNGSGKSSLARHCNALLLPTEGEVRVKGMDTRDPRYLWDIRRTVGMVFQNPDNQLVATVVEEDVAFGPENLGLPPAEIRRRVDEALEAVELTALATREPHHLSGGQKQRVAIAGILAMRPECLVLDEPTAMLDPASRREVMRTLRKLNAEGITVILITHYMEEAAEADRVIVLDRGQVALQGSPREVFAQVERLRELDLSVPEITELAHLLRQDGFDLPPGVLTAGELVEALCPY